MKLGRWLAGPIMMALALTSAQTAPAEEPGVSHTLAIARAARLSDLRYKLSFAIAASNAVLDGSEQLTFTDSGSGDLSIDFRDGTLSSVVLNGRTLPTNLVNGHLTLPAAALIRNPRGGTNDLRIEFKANSGPAGNAITRYHDQDDGLDYLYTLFVPMDASMAFPCFDQPDLKARFTLTVDAPSNWTVISNTAGHLLSGNPAHHATAFEETFPISTYLFAFTAGPWQQIPGAKPGEPSIYVRKSQLARAQAEAPQVQQMASRGIAWLVQYFQQPFPFPKYDLVLVPGFPFGGMEHAGATFLNEDGVLFRTAPTESDRFRRNILVLHETTHQWFGDLVTMRWFDDLWLKEGFAQYTAYKALAELEPTQLPWKHFYEDIKPAAYGIDETQGTTPIFQNIANLKDAKSAYGAIVYQKAPAVLKQLNYFLGEDNFRDGLRMYLKQHAYANAQWADLVDAFAKTGNKDVKAWAKAWILQRGMPQVQASFECADGRIKSLTLSQLDVLHESHLWPISNEVLLQSEAGQTTLRMEWGTASYSVHEALGKTCPSYVFANADDFAYGRFLLDPASEKFVAGRVSAPSFGATPLQRTMLWGALWDNVHVAQSPPRGYVQLALKALPTEEDETLARIQGGRITTALHAYMADKGRAEYLPGIEAISADRMLHASTLNLRIVSFRTFSGVAETPQALGQIKALLSGSLQVPGMPLKPLDRWNLIGHLIAMNDPDAIAIFAAEKAKDHSGEGQKYAYAVEAGIPSADVKAHYFDEYLHSATRPEDWITQSLGRFNSWNQTSLTEPYLTRALDQLPDIKQHRKIFFLGAWLGAFIDGQHSPQAQMAVHAWLANNKIDPDLRLKVLEVSDALDRTVMIRQRFPE